MNRQWMHRSVMLIGFQVFVFSTVRAQLSPAAGWFQERESKSYVMAHGAAVVTSADVDNQFGLELLRSESLSTESREAFVSRVNDMNRLGTDYDAGVYARIGIRQTPHAYIVKLADVGHADALIPRTALGLTFFGNSRYAGDTVRMTDMRVQVLRYQQVSLGWSYTGSRLSMYAALSALNGEQLVRANVDEAWVYTSAMGDTLSSGAQGWLVQSDTSLKGFMAPNGGGAALDVGIGYQFRQSETSTPWHFDLQLSNLGFMQWRPATWHARADTVVEFRGIAIGDLNEAQAVIERLPDSADRAIDDLTHKGVYNMLLPGWLQVSMMPYRPGGFEVGAQAAWRWNANYRTYMQLCGGYRFVEHGSIHAFVGYGGYGTWQLGVQGSVHFSDFTASLQLANLEAWIMPAQFAGGTARLTLRYVL